MLFAAVFVVELVFALVHLLVAIFSETLSNVVPFEACVFASAVLADWLALDLDVEAVADALVFAVAAEDLALRVAVFADLTVLFLEVSLDLTALSQIGRASCRERV